MSRLRDSLNGETNKWTGKLHEAVIGAGFTMLAERGGALLIGRENSLVIPTSVPSKRHAEAVARKVGLELV